MRKNRGITLVALVITIIVLLILAGVSISLVVGDNGVLTQAQNASKSTNKSSAAQALDLALVSLQSKFLGETWSQDATAKMYDTYTLGNLDTELQKNGFYIVDDDFASTKGNKVASASGATQSIVIAGGKAANDADHKADKKTQYTATLTWKDTSVEVTTALTQK